GDTARDAAGAAAAAAGAGGDRQRGGDAAHASVARGGPARVDPLEQDGAALDVRRRARRGDRAASGAGTAVVGAADVGVGAAGDRGTRAAVPPPRAPVARVAR